MTTSLKDHSAASKQESVRIHLPIRYCTRCKRVTRVNKSRNIITYCPKCRNPEFVKLTAVATCKKQASGKPWPPKTRRIGAVK